MIAVDHSNANGALPIHVRTARRACAHNPDDRPDVLQCHQLIDLEADAELALETAREGRVPERVPLLNVIRLGIERQRARIQIEGALESVLYARQIKVRHDPCCSTLRRSLSQLQTAGTTAACAMISSSRVSR